jgi:hypothetical protein
MQQPCVLKLLLEGCLHHLQPAHWSCADDEFAAAAAAAAADDD